MVATTLLARQHHYILISNGLIFLQLIMQYTHKKTNNWKFTILIIQLGIIIKIETDKRIVSFTASSGHLKKKQNINITKIQKYDITFEFNFKSCFDFPTPSIHVCVDGGFGCCLPTLPDTFLYLRHITSLLT